MWEQPRICTKREFFLAYIICSKGSHRIFTLFNTVFELDSHLFFCSRRCTAIKQAAVRCAPPPFLSDTVGRGGLVLASNPGSHPAFRRLPLFRTASDEKLDESLGSRLGLCPTLATQLCKSLKGSQIFISTRCLPTLIVKSTAITRLHLPIVIITVLEKASSENLLRIEVFPTASYPRRSSLNKKSYDLAIFEG